VNPRRFAGKPLTLKRLADEDFIVMIDGLAAGRIFKTSRIDRTVWLWILTGPYFNAPLAKLAGSGEVSSFREAKAAFKAAFRAWQRWAAAGGESAAWHG
jgi:hypothetical protein